MRAAVVNQAWPRDQGPRRQLPFRRRLTWALAVVALAGALLGAGCNASWLGNNQVSRGEGGAPPGNSLRLLQNAHYYKLMGQPGVALQQLQEAYRMDPDNPKVVDALAQMYQELGKFQQAQELYQKALKRYAANRALRNNWCFSFYLQGDLPRAESCFKEALARDPGNTTARNNLGLVWCRQGKLAEAKRLWEEADGAAAAQTRLNQALAFLGMSAPASYARLSKPGERKPLAESSVQPPERDLNLAQPRPAAAPAPQEQKSGPPLMLASQNGSLLTEKPRPAEAAPVNKAAPAAAPPAAPPPVVAAAAPEPARRPEAAAPAPAAPLVASPAKTPAVRAPIMAVSSPPTRLAKVAQAAPAPANVKKAAKPARRTILSAQERVGTGIEIENGNGMRNLAHLARADLTREIFNVTRIGNHIDFGAETTVIYYRPGTERVARVLNSEVFPKAQLVETSRLRKGVGIKVLLGRDLLEQPLILARLMGKGTGASPQAPLSRPAASRRPAASLTLAAAAASGAARAPLRDSPSAPPAKTVAPPGNSPAYLTANELVANVIEIQNGTRARFLARRTRVLLSAQGFHVGWVGNSLDFGAKNTVIYYQAGAEKVARVLNSQFFPRAALVVNPRLPQGVAISILLGRDLLEQPQIMARLLGNEHETY